MFNPFRKNKSVSGNNSPASDQSAPAPTVPPKNDDEKSSVKDKFLGVGMNMMQKIAMKKMAKMSPQEQQKMMADMLKPENKGKMLEVMEYMKKSGQITEEQYQDAKKRLGVL